MYFLGIIFVNNDLKMSSCVRNDVGVTPTSNTNNSSIVQSVERMTVNHYVTGSSPVRGAVIKHKAFPWRLL